MFYKLKKDFERFYALQKGNKIKKFLNCWRSPGLHAVIIYRFGYWVIKQNIFIKIFCLPVYMFLSFLMNILWGIALRKNCEIGEGLYIAHYGGIFIAANAKIGKNFTVSQDVTIGVSGQGEKRGWPTIGNNVSVAPGAKIIGKIKIGDNVKIGVNAVVYKDIPDNCIVVSDSLKIIPRKDL